MSREGSRRVDKLIILPYTRLFAIIKYLFMDPRAYQFLKQVITKAHGETMPEALREKMITDLSIQLETTLLRRLLDQLTEADQQAYSLLIQEHPANETVSAFFEQRIPDIQQQMEKVMTGFEQDYLAYMKK